MEVVSRVGGAPLRIALLGCGVVGSQVARLLTGQAADLAARAGGPLEIAGDRGAATASGQGRQSRA